MPQNRYGNCAAATVDLLQSAQCPYRHGSVCPHTASALCVSYQAPRMPPGLGEGLFSGSKSLHIVVDVWQGALLATDTVGVLTRALPWLPAEGLASAAILIQRLATADKTQAGRQAAAQFIAAGGLQLSVLER